MKTKITFTYFDLENKIAEETIWAKPQSVLNLFKVDNIPFFAPNISLGDIVRIEEDENTFYFDELVEASGNSTIQIIFLDADQIDKTIAKLESYNSDWESMKGKPYYAINIPSTIDYSIIKLFLNQQSDLGFLDYREACLSTKHQSEKR